MLGFFQSSQWSAIVAQLKDVNLLSTFVRICLAALMGGLIGTERGRRRRAAGLRTHMLVCIGAALVMITNQYIVTEFGSGDPTRLGAQVISGIGFLGVGTIMVDNKHQRVRGLTTAAGLWACACMGLAIGIGFYSGALIACLFIIATITVLNNLEPYIVSRSRTMEIYTEFEDQGDFNRFLGVLSSGGIKITDLESVIPRGTSDKEDDRIAWTMMLQLPKNYRHSEIIKQLEELSGILLIEEVK